MKKNSTPVSTKIELMKHYCTTVPGSSLASWLNLARSSFYYRPSCGKRGVLPSPIDLAERTACEQRIRRGGDQGHPAGLRINPATRTIPVVFLSATYVAPEDKLFAQSIGVNRFVEKPVDLVKFLPIVERILAQGENAPVPPLSEAEFYDGYRKRLEIKLTQKMVQISRDEHILTNLTDEERASIKGSLSAAINEREEIQNLLDQIRELAEKPNKPPEQGETAENK